MDYFFSPAYFGVNWAFPVNVPGSSSVFVLITRDKHRRHTRKIERPSEILFLVMLFQTIRLLGKLNVRERMGWVRNVVLMNVYLDLEKPRGVGILGEGPHGAGEGNEGSVYEQPGKEVDGSCHSKEGSK